MLENKMMNMEATMNDKINKKFEEKEEELVEKVADKVGERLQSKLHEASQKLGEMKTVIEETSVDHRPKPASTSSPGTKSKNMQETISEMKDRESRKSNLILYRMQEPKSNLKSEMIKGRQGGIPGYV